MSFHRPIFYTNFVTTLDGKTAVKSPGYWPIGSKKDYQMLLKLRAEADALVHGKNLYKEFGDITTKNLKKPSFRKMRVKIGKNPDLPYYQATRNIKKMVADFTKRGYSRVLIEGGPTLLGSFLKEDLLDELHLTIAPKIYGSSDKTLTLIEGILFKPGEIKNFKLVSVKKVGDELFLKYRTIR